jgi:hypothetical protein
VSLTKKDLPKVDTPWMSQQEVAAYLRISSGAVHRLVHQHQVLTQYRIPELKQSPLYRRDEVEGLVLPDVKRRTAVRPPTPRERRDTAPVNFAL